jgi:hypothetical protein
MLANVFRKINKLSLILIRYTIEFYPSRHYVYYGWFAETTYTYVFVEYISLICVKAYEKKTEK